MHCVSFHAKKGWKGVFDFGIEKEWKATNFRPDDWPVKEDENYCAWYALDFIVAGKKLKWLSYATGVRGAGLCFYFDVDSSCFNMTRQCRGKLEDLYNKSDLFKEKGFIFKGRHILRPFHFDAEKLIEEFPEFNKSLRPLDDALEDLFDVHDVFDEFVKSLVTSA
jgi:hypothetical protein